MSENRLEHLLFGALELELRGRYWNQVITDLQHAGIPLHEIRARDEKCRVLISLRDFSECYKRCRKYGVKIRFTERLGFPFFIKRALRRKTLLIGPVLFLAVLWLCSSVVWQVDVGGGVNDEESRQAVLQAARESGLYPGAMKRNLPDATGLQNRIIQHMPSLVWVGVQITGAKASVEVVDSIPGVSNSPQSPHNIVASKPAVIRQVFANRGEVLVQPGQVVQPGQILISGDLGQGAKRVPADGRALAEVWYTTKVEVPLQVTQQTLSGNNLERQYLRVGPLAVRILGWKQPKFQNFIERDDTTDWRIGSWVLPVQWVRRRLYEADAVALSRSTTDAEKQAKELAVQDVQTQSREEATILGQTVLHTEVLHGKLYETILTRTEENIGVAQPIPAAPAPNPGQTGGEMANSPSGSQTATHKPQNPSVNH